MRALVTGASGFIGRHLVRDLVAGGHSVTCLVRNSSRTEPLTACGAALAWGDVVDPASVAAAVHGTDVVFHLAGLTKALSYKDLLAVNEQGTHNVAAACAQQAPPPVLVVVSSLAAAGPAPSDRPRCEADPPQPVSNYGRSKRAGELAAARFADRVPLSIVRPPIVFGEGDQDMLAMFRPIKWLRVHPVPGFTERRASMVHVEDLVRLLVATAARGERVAADTIDDPGRGCYFVAAERDPTFSEWGQLIAQALGYQRLRVLRTPEKALWVAAWANETLARIRRRPHIFSRDKIREATAGSWVCGAQRAREHLGFAVAADLQARFDQTARWYRAQGWI